MAEENNERMSAATNEASQLSRPNDGDNVSVCSRRFSLNSALETFMNYVGCTSPLDGSDITLKQIKMLHGEMWGNHLPIQINMDNFSKNGQLYEETEDLLQKGYLQRIGDIIVIPQGIDERAIAAKYAKFGNDKIIEGLIGQFHNESKKDS